MRFTRKLKQKANRAKFDLRVWATDRMAFARGQHKNYLAEYNGRAPLPGNPGRVAIVASFPNPNSNFSTINLLDALQAAGFRTLLVSTKCFSDEEREVFLTHCHHLIERYQVGRDFGSYQVGLTWIEANGLTADMKHLALVNDSLFYPKSFANQLCDLPFDTSDWISLFENYEIHYHAQSFFQIFSRRVVESKAFKDFWSTYVPWSTRGHSIDKGEVGLSQALTRHGFKPLVLYRASRVCEDVYTHLASGNWDPGIVNALKQSLGAEFHSIIEQTGKTNRAGNLDPASGGETDSHYAALAADLVMPLSALMQYRNPTAFVGLLCNVLYEAPLKRDLVYRQVLSIGVVTTFCKGFDARERELIADDLRHKGVPSWRSRKMWDLYHGGRI